MENVLIAGAGLSGLTAAYYLKKAGIDVLILEARERCGGRILTVNAEGNATPVEMGATWFAAKHTYLVNLLKELQIAWYNQYQKGIAVIESFPSEPPQLFELPDTAEPSFRIAGGTSALIHSLIAYIGKDHIVMDTAIANVAAQEHSIVIQDKNGQSFKGTHVILAIPPSLLLAQKVEFVPALPETCIHVMQSTHTWMGEALKFALEYKQPFWRQKGFSGTVFSHSGIAQEVYDHTNADETRFALKGFLSPDAIKLSRQEREALLVAQLKRLLGTEAGNFLSYTEKIWAEDRYTYSNYTSYVTPHQNNGHPLFSQPLMQDRLYLAGAETSPHFGGYMDGAVYSGLSIANKIIDKIKQQ
ncbi:MAG TPA: NAD(P)/FAD-dependent oxidoreductase [Flavisolibacter sp.]|nr:NAD(P)/FAD-dependent oxidoreductase [Flavisolibacter sp.]